MISGVLRALPAPCATVWEREMPTIRVEESTGSRARGAGTGSENDGNLEKMKLSKSVPRMFPATQGSLDIRYHQILFQKCLYASPTTPGTARDARGARWMPQEPRGRVDHHISGILKDLSF